MTNSEKEDPLVEKNNYQQQTTEDSESKYQQTQEQKQQQMNVIDHEDPLLIAQSLTYITDDGSVVVSFAAAPFSFAFKMRFVFLETIFVLLLVMAVPIGAHGTIVWVTLGNLAAVAWFWYNSVRSVEVTSDGGLRFFIGNFEVDVPFDKIVNLRRVSINNPCSIVSLSLAPHRGYLSSPSDGVAVITSMPSEPLWLWPRSANRQERRCCFGIFGCPRLVVVFSPAGGSLNFINDVENEMKHSSGEIGTDDGRRYTKQMQQPPEYPPPSSTIGNNTSSSSVVNRPVSAAGKDSLSGNMYDV